MTDTKYKLEDLDKTQITAAARKALMAADAQYYAWTRQQQQQFRATMNESARNKISQVLLDSLLGIKCDKENVDKVWNKIPLAKLNILNWANLLTRGIGEDTIYLNEPMASGKSLLDFTTLYDYDYADHLFQQQANKRDFSEYQEADYYAYKHPSWIRLLIEDRFYYATFTSLATHLIDEIGTMGQDIINQLIPHQYVNGKDDGKSEKGGFLWDKQLDAEGLEGQLDELNSRWYVYLQQRWLLLSEYNSQLPAAVYMQDKDWDDDPHRFFIFNNAAALKKLRWQHFLSDCKPLMDDYSAVEIQLEQEINQARFFLEENHQDIMTNFDPSVIKLRRKRKIIMTDGALDDIDRLSNKNEDNQE